MSRFSNSTIGPLVIPFQQNEPSLQHSLQSLYLSFYKKQQQLSLNHPCPSSFHQIQSNQFVESSKQQLQKALFRLSRLNVVLISFFRGFFALPLCEQKLKSFYPFLEIHQILLELNRILQQLKQYSRNQPPLYQLGH